LAVVIHQQRGRTGGYTGGRGGVVEIGAVYTTKAVSGAARAGRAG